MKGRQEMLFVKRKKDIKEDIGQSYFGNDFMVTTAYRSVVAMRKLGYHSETTEHRMGKFRKDLFDVADGIAFKANEPAILFQAFHKKDEEKHAWINAEYTIVKDWLATGNKFEFHRWS